MKASTYLNYLSLNHAMKGCMYFSNVDTITDFSETPR